ncbi:MAG TPA: MFS transporter, partial [Aggregatilineales bacterium]|nr:MFS transporter [Aggregatilineales bacterium]
LPLSFFGPGWTALLGELVPEGRRAFVVSRRSIIWAIGIAIVSWLAGVWLDHVPFPLNYQWMYVFGVAFSILNQFVLSKLIIFDREPSSTPIADKAEAKVQLSAPMRRLLLNMAVYQFGLTLPGQLFTIFFINSLNATDGWLGISNAAAQLGVVVGYFLWERIFRRWSFNKGLRRATLLTWVFPVGIVLFPTMPAVALFNFIVNTIHPAVDLSTFNLLLNLCSAEERQTYVSWWTMTVNASLFIAPLVGVWVSNQYGIPAVLLLSGLFRVVGGIMFNLNGIENRTVKFAHAPTH